MLERQSSDSRRSRKLESTRLAPQPGATPTPQAQPLFSLQQQAGNRAVSGVLFSLQQQAGNRAVSGLARSNRDASRLAPRPAITPLSSGRAVIQRVLKEKVVKGYVTQLQAKTALPTKNLVRLINEKLTKNNDAVTVEHVTQILEALKVTVPKNLAALVAGESTTVTLPAFQARFNHAAGTPVDGYEKAKKKKMTQVMGKEVPVLIAALTTGNMFLQHDGSAVRYDSQNAGPTTTNLQIQLGGEDVYVEKQSADDKSSVSVVVVDDSIVKICGESPEVATYVLAEMKSAHTNSFADGNKRFLTLDPEA